MTVRTGARAAVGLFFAILASVAQAEGQNSDVRAPAGIWLTQLGNGPTSVIVLHGGPGLTHRYLRPEWDVLSDEVRVVYYDQRGCGASERTDDVTWEELVADLDTIVMSASSLGAVVLAGSSWGASLALAYAWSHPGHVDALVLSGVPSLEFALPRLQTPAWEGLPGVSSVHRERRIWMDSVYARYYDSLGGYDPPSVRDSVDVVREPRKLDPVIAARVGMDCPRVHEHIDESMRETGPLPRDLESISVPTLIIGGPEPVPVLGDGSAHLDSIMPNSWLVSIAGTSHDPWLQQPSEFFLQVRRFLAEQGLTKDGS